MVAIKWRSWLQSIQPKLHSALLSHPLATDWLRQQLKVPNICWERFASPFSRLLLLPQDKLFQLLTLIGGICYHSDFLHLIESTARRQLCQQLGAQNVQFIEQNGALMLHQTPPLFDAVRRHFPLWHRQKQSLVDLRYAGALICALMLENNQPSGANSQDETALWYRYLQLQLPRPPATTEKPQSDKLPAADKHVHLIIKKLVRQLEPTCLHLLN